MQPRNFHIGDPARWFVVCSTEQRRFSFDIFAGRYAVLCFLGSAGDAAAALHVALVKHRRLLDGTSACLLAISIDADDERQGRLRQSPGILDDLGHRSDHQPPVRCGSGV